MLLSHRYRFIYTKTIKTGGTSVESYFEKYCMKEEEWAFSHVRDEYVSESGIIGYRGTKPDNARFFHHMSANSIRKLVGDKTWEQYYKFCVVRNPYDKLLSAFFYLDIKNNNFNGSNKQLIDRFRNWVKVKAESIVDRDKYVINSRVCMDDFIKTETIRSDLERVCNRIGVPYEPDRVPRLKAGFRPPDISHHDYYDDHTDAIVRRYFAFEFELFGYPFLDLASHNP